MRRLLSTVFLASLALGVTACGNDDAVKPTGPITLTFRTQVHLEKNGTARDTVTGIIIVDGTDTLDLPYDSIVGFPRGQHSFEAHLSNDYLPVVFGGVVDPNTDRLQLPIIQEVSCRIWADPDIPYCRPAVGQPGSVTYWSKRTRLYCPVNDFGDFCTYMPDPEALGLRWPVDAASSQDNEYVAQGRLLIAATVGPELGVDAGKKIATGLYTLGDYGPRRRLREASDDSSRYSVVTWTDLRHEPLYGFSRATLEYGDRQLALFGLEVKATYFQPVQYQDVYFIRFDVRNVSHEADYRRVHPDAPAAGFTVHDIFLTPTLDPDIGGVFGSENKDDAATVFHNEKLIVAYDRNFDIAANAGWDFPWADAPGLVGLQLISTDAGGDARAVLTTSLDTLDYAKVAAEAKSHTILSAGRGATLTGCTATAQLFNCTPETGSDVRVGWSVGPIASLAPNETRSLTIAILLAAPKAGSFVNGTGAAPQNNAIGDNSRAIFNISEPLRALAAQVAGTPVTPVP